MAEDRIFTFDIEDQHYLAAENSTSSQLSPHLQKAVRDKVLTKRQERGEPFIKAEFNEPKKYELTAEEKEKKERRKKQNREAARRCRQKKKHGDTGTNKKLNGLKHTNGDLQKEVNDLKVELNQLQTILAEHERSGLCIQTNNAQQQTCCPTSVSGDLSTGPIHVDYGHSQLPSPVVNTGHLHHVPQFGQMAGPLTFSANQSGIQDDRQVPDYCYSPVSDVTNSPYTDQQMTVDNQWQSHQTDDNQYHLPDEVTGNLEGYFVPPSDMNSEFVLNQGLPVTSGTPDWVTDDTPKRHLISGTDKWLNNDQDSNRVTPDTVQDDNASLYPTSFPSGVYKPGPEVTSNGNIGIPSLDCIQLQELVTTNLVLPDFFPKNMPRQ